VGLDIVNIIIKNIIVRIVEPAFVNMTKEKTAVGIAAPDIASMEEININVEIVELDIVFTKEEKIVVKNVVVKSANNLN
jgi:hypothetical protein